MTRDLSPLEWQANGKALLELFLILESAGGDPVPLDTWISNYSGCEKLILNWSSGANTVAWYSRPNSTGPGAGNARFVVIIPPRGNTTSIRLKGVSGDTGFLCNSDAPIVFTLPASGYSNSCVVTTGGAISNVICLIF